MKETKTSAEKVVKEPKPKLMVSKNLIVAFGILALPAGIAGVAFHGVDDPVFHLFHDPHMIRHSVLALVPIVPIEEDQVAGARLIVAV